MLWLQKTPNGKTGFRHTWGVKWSPSPGRIGQMVAVRLIMIACKMEALLLSSLTKRLSFPAVLFFLPLFYRFVYSCGLRWKQKCSVLFEIKSGMCLVQATEWESVVAVTCNPFHLTREDSWRVCSVEPQSQARFWTPTTRNWSKAAHIRWQLSWSLSPQSLAKSSQGTLLIGTCSPPFLPTVWPTPIQHVLRRFPFTL